MHDDSVTYFSKSVHLIPCTSLLEH